MNLEEMKKQANEGKEIDALTALGLIAIYEAQEKELEKTKQLLNDAIIQISRKNADISRGKWEQIKAEIEDLNRDAPEDVIFNTFDCKNCGPSIWKGNLDENGQETGGCCFNCGDPNY